MDWTFEELLDSARELRLRHAATLLKNRALLAENRRLTELAEELTCENERLKEESDSMASKQTRRKIERSKALSKENRSLKAKLSGVDNEQLRRKLRLPSGPDSPYGWRQVKGADGVVRLEEDPEQQRWLRHIITWFSEGAGHTRIADQLNQSGCPARMLAGTEFRVGYNIYTASGRWEARHVARILGNNYTRDLARDLAARLPDADPKMGCHPAPP